MTNSDDQLGCFFNKKKSEFQKIKDDIIDGTNFSEDQIKRIQDRLDRMIDYAIDRHDWYDSHRHKFLQIGISLLASGAAISAILARLTNELSIFVEILSWVGSISLIFTGGYLIYLYNNGISQDHPYRKVVDIRSWFFKYNFHSNSIGELSKDPAIAKEQIETTVEAMKNFSQRWIEIAKDENGFLKEDLEQVFILQLLQKNRSEQVKVMSKSLSRGIAVSFTAIIVAILIHIFTVTYQTEATVIKEETTVEQLSINNLSAQNIKVEISNSDPAIEPENKSRKKE